uniref:Uncharacterized protein n=1 Tax=Lactuca sativa TaxID=4236 RepID=A0A9R1W9P5_LACSA|nr:hypothetical protein LSAT_V11C200064150 [Lactuca sativa]
MIRSMSSFYFDISNMIKLYTLKIVERIPRRLTFQIKSCLIRLLKSMHLKSLGTYTYKNNPKMVGSLDMILIDQQILYLKITINFTLCKNIRRDVREIGTFVMASNEGDYMLLPQKHKINFYKTTKVRVSIDFVNMVNPYDFVAFPDLLVRNFDTCVAFGMLFCY